MNILIVSPVHAIDDIRIGEKQTVSLCNQGYSVSAICRRPKTVPYSVEHMASVSYVPDFRFRFFRFLYLFNILYLVFRSGADLVIFHNPDTLPLAFIAKFFGKKVAYDTHEDFSMRILSRRWIPSVFRPLIAKFVARAESMGSNFFDLTIVTQNQMLGRFNAEKTIIIENAPIYVGSSIERQRSFGECKETFDILRLCYIGNISPEREIEKIVKLAFEVSQFRNVSLILVGDGPVEYMDFLRGLKEWCIVEHMGWVPHARVDEIAENCDIGLILLPDLADFKYTSPNKIFEYCGAGLPFLASDFEGWQQKFVGFDCGFFVDPNAEADIIKFIVSLDVNSDEFFQRRQDCKMFIKNHFNWDLVSVRFLDRVEVILQS